MEATNVILNQLSRAIKHKVGNHHSSIWPPDIFEGYTVVG